MLSITAFEPGRTENLIELRLLGAVEITVGAVSIPLGHAKRRCVLAALLMDANRMVSLDTLVYRVWEDCPPRTVRNVIAGYLGRLRAALAAHSEGHEQVLRIGRTNGGYIAEVPPENIDLYRFRSLVDQGRDTCEHDVDTATDLLGEALSLWRGDALAGLPGCWADATRHCLGQERSRVRLDLYQAELKRGRHLEVVRDLELLAEDQPMDEVAQHSLMIALYRCGRQADALGVYENLRQRLADGLGVDPMPVTKRLFEQILKADRALDMTPAGPTVRSAGMRKLVPEQLPQDASPFVGRSGELIIVTSCLARPGEVVAIDGMPGVGKTALAVRAAQRTSRLFPDGRLYIDLCGHDGERHSLDPGEALARFLRALGTRQSDIPVSTDERAAMFRTLLGNRGVLLLLDNAASTEQVAPLLPAHKACGVLVTSRTPLVGLVAKYGVRRLSLACLSNEESFELLGELLGVQRRDAERATARELCRHCAHLPLALRIVGANLASRPYVGLTDAVTWLTAECPAGRSIRGAINSAFDTSYQALAPPLRRFLRHLAVSPAGTFTVRAAAALANVTPAEAGSHIDVLVQSQLLQQSASDRYHLHGLVRSYLSGLTESDDDPPGYMPA